jgi:Fur family transcriptional regulator, ferric uptake regulator
VRAILVLIRGLYQFENGYHSAMVPETAWLEHSGSVIKRAGFRSGGARLAVLAELARQDCCVSAQEIHDALHASGRSVGIASVYRILDLLSELRLVQRVDVGDGIARYEPAGLGGDHHHHVVCDDCGRVEPFSDSSLERAIASISRRLGYDVAGHDVVLRGECGDCRVSG